MKLQVTACDIDKKFPAKTYTITASDGRTVSKDLCEEHAEPFEEWLEEAELVDEPLDAEEGSLDEEEVEPAPQPAPAKKAPAKKAAPKRAATRRRSRVTSLEEIEASKKR